MESFHCGTCSIDIHYRAGGPFGPPLVLLHGMTSRLQSWDYLLPDILPDWQVYAVDLRGHGLSEHPQSGYRFRDYGDDIVSFLQRVVQQPAILLGHSLGAVTALLAAASIGPGVRGLVLCDPPLFPWHTPIEDTPFHDWFAFVQQARRRAQTIEQLEQICQDSMPGLPVEAARDLSHTLWQVAPQAVAAGLQNAMTVGTDLWSVLGKIDCPALFLQGERHLGAALWDEDVGPLQQAMPQAVVAKIPAVGHMTNMAVADILAQLAIFHEME